MRIIEAIKKLDGKPIISHKPIFEMCGDSVKSVRRIGPEIRRLIAEGAITESRVNVNGISYFKYDAI